MKRTFWTWNVFIGVLTGLVMLLGVQDTANAISRLTRSSGDLQTVIAGNDYQIRFSVTLQSASRIPGFKPVPSRDESDPPATVPAADRTNMFYDDDPDIEYIHGTTATVDYAAAHYYDQESIAITASGGEIKRVGSHDTSGASLTMYERTHASYSTTENPHQRLSGSVTLTLTAPATAPTDGYVDITIDPTTDGSATFTEQPDLVFRVYVVAPLDTTTTVALVAADTNEAWVIGNDHAPKPINTLFTPATSNAPVIYKVEGPGRLYVGVGDRKSRSLQTLSTSKAAPVYLDMNGGSNRVSIRGRDRSATESLLVIFNEAQIEIISGNDQTGVPDSRLRDPLGIRVKDAKGRPLSGLAVKFDPADGATLEPVIGTDVYLLASGAWASGATFPTIDRTKLVTATVPPRTGTNAIAADTAGWVPTDRSGEAQVYLKLGAEGPKTVTVSAGGAREKRFDLTSSESTDIPSLEIVSGDNQRSASDGKVANPLVVRVLASNNQPLPTQVVTFTTTKGYLTTVPGYALSASPVNGPATQVKAQTNVNGRAAVRYDLVEHSGAADVIAEISRTGTAPYQRRVTFNINGSSTRQPTTREPAPPAAPTNRIGISLSSSTGEPGDEIEVTVRSDPSGRTVRLTSDDFADSLFSPQSGTTPFDSTLTLPDEDGEYTITAEGFPLDSGSATVTVETGILGRITVSRVGQPSNGAQNFSIRVVDTDGDRISSALTVRLSGRGFTTRNVETLNGVGNARLTLPTTAGTYTLTASAEDYTSGTTTVRIAAPERPQDPDEEEVAEEEEEEVEEEASPASIRVSGPANRSGTVDTQLDAPLLAQVLNAGGDGVEDVRVIFRVKEGRGRLSQRGNGRAIGIRTDSRGFARADYTPLSASSTVEAEVAGVTRKASFTITTAGAAPTDTTRVDTYTVGDSISALGSGFPSELSGASFQSRGGQRIFTFSNNGKIVQGGITYTCSSVGGCTIQGERVTQGTIEATRPATPSQQPRSTEDPTPRTIVSPVLNAAVGAASRPPMLWVSGGQIYGLIGAEVKVFISGVENAMNLAVGGDKVYWTAKTSDTHGTLNSANLDGTGAKELRSLWGVPRGIAVDITGSKLYWVDAANRLQRANLDGSGIENVLRNLSDPQDIVFAGGNVYWIGNGAGTDTLSFITLTDPKKVIHPIAATSGTYGGLAVGGNKVYWTVQTSDTHGTLRAANLDGTGEKELRTDPIWGAPVGIAVDTARSRLYWTDAVGRLQRSNLDASGIHNVAKGLGRPGDMVISNSIQAPTGTTTTTGSGKGKYDVNGDGKVDVKDSDMLLLAVTAGITDAKYDVNGDGKVDVNDIVDVTANRDKGAAGAPALLGTKFTAVERDRLQEQIDLLIATGDRSPAALKTLIYLQQLLVMARPEKTQLLANYPNPFNPETWIPYELATDTDVRITIYNAQGVVVRVLSLGQQSAGYYTDRERAAYWDGRNALGEQVASGIYFYQFETDEMSSMRKMVILK